jgi:hypothetical protein
VAPGRSQTNPSFPTILVFGLDRTLIDALYNGRFNVLEANGQTGLMDAVRYHSRPIHLLLMDLSIDNRSLAALLKRYRPTMRVLYVGNDIPPDVVSPELLVGAVDQLFASQDI